MLFKLVTVRKLSGGAPPKRSSGWCPPVHRSRGVRLCVLPLRGLAPGLLARPAGRPARALARGGADGRARAISLRLARPRRGRGRSRRGGLALGRGRAPLPRGGLRPGGRPLAAGAAAGLALAGAAIAGGGRARRVRSRLSAAPARRRRTRGAAARRRRVCRTVRPRARRVRRSSVRVLAGLRKDWTCELWGQAGSIVVEVEPHNLS